jgi:hypothetical protein
MALPVKAKNELKTWVYYAIIKVAEQYQITYEDINDTIIDLLSENSKRNQQKQQTPFKKQV